MQFSIKFQPFESSILPLPSSSMPFSEISPLFDHMFPTKSSCVISIPVSIIATVTPFPVEFFHASVTPASHKYVS